MNIILVLDDNNYTADMPIVQKTGARGVILRDGKIAVQKGKAGDCKILGGGMEGAESAADSLYREVLEEAGLYIIKDKVKELGTVVERRQDLYQQGVLYCCNTTYYLCEIEERTTTPNLTPSELAKGYDIIVGDPLYKLIMPKNSSARFIERPHRAQSGRLYPPTEKTIAEVIGEV